MVLKLSSISLYLQLQIAPKMNTKDFVQFVGSSTHAYDLSKMMIRRVTKCMSTFTIYGDYKLSEVEGVLIKDEFFQKVELVPIRLSIGTIQCNFHFTEENCKLVSEFFLKTLSSCGLLSRLTISYPTCSPVSFGKLLESGRIQELKTQFIKEELLRIPAVFKLKSLNAGWAIDDEQFLQLEACKMNLRNVLVTSDGINRFLKQWVAWKREIRDIKIFNTVGWNLSKILEDMDYSLGIEARLKSYDYEIRRPGEKNFLLLKIGTIKITITRHEAKCVGDCVYRDD